MKYSLYGLTLETPFPCPELPSSTGETDVIVHWGEFAADAPGWRDEGVCYKAAPGKYLLSIAGVADYLVTNGSEVTICKALEGDNDSLRLFFYHEVMGALLMQRGYLLLKGCVVERDGKGIAFTGPSPSGKTMMAARLARQGYQIVSDGFFCLTGQVKPMAQPGLPRLVLWDRGLRDLDIPREAFKPVRAGMQRFYLPLESTFHNEPVQLETIYALTFGNRLELLIEEAKGAEKLFTLLAHRYHPELTAPLGTIETVNRVATNLANAATVKTIRYSDTLVPFDDYMERLGQELEDTTR